MQPEDSREKTSRREIAEVPQLMGENVGCSVDGNESRRRRQLLGDRVLEATTAEGRAGREQG